MAEEYKKEDKLTLCARLENLIKELDAADEAIAKTCDEHDKDSLIELRKRLSSSANKISNQLRKLSIERSIAAKESKRDEMILCVLAPAVDALYTLRLDLIGRSKDFDETLGLLLHKFHAALDQIRLIQNMQKEINADKARL